MKIQVLSLVVGIILPILVGIVTTRATHSGVKAVLLALLAAVSGFGAELLDALTTSAHFDAGAAVLSWLGTFLVAVATHFGFWKPTGTSRYMQANVGRTGYVIEKQAR